MVNRECVSYLRSLGRDVDTRERYITYRIEDGVQIPEYFIMDEMCEWRPAL